jgi:hypothetical protein
VSRVLAWTGIGVALSGALACSGQSLSSELPPPTTFIARLAVALCEDVAPCCARAHFAHAPAACAAREQLYLQNHFRLGPGPRVVYDPNAESSCLQAVAACVRQCEGPELLGELDGVPSLAICSQVLQGTQAVGEPCDTWADCNTSVSTGYVTCQGGVCVYVAPPGALPPSNTLQAGDPCTVSQNLELCASECSPGTYCDITGVCEAQRESGPCTDLCDESCTSASYCDYVNQICAPKTPEGGACTIWDACQGDNIHCQSNNTCAADLLTLCTTSASP